MAPRVGHFIAPRTISVSTHVAASVRDLLDAPADDNMGKDNYGRTNPAGNNGGSQWISVEQVLTAIWEHERGERHRGIP